MIRALFWLWRPKEIYFDMIGTRYDKTKTSCSICTPWKEVQEQLHNLSRVAPTLSLMTTFKYNIQLRGCLYAGRRDGTLNGSRHACIYLLLVLFRLYGKNFAETFFVPPRQIGILVRTTEILVKAGQFLWYKHSVPLCRDFILYYVMLCYAINRNIKRSVCSQYG